jgi:polyferredoxin
MDRIGRPRGLIRYSSRDELEGRASRMLRPRVVIYPLALAVTFGLFLAVLVTRPDTEVTVLGGVGAPYVMQPDGRVLSQVRLKVVNRATHDRRYRFAVEGAEGGDVVIPINPLAVGAGRMQTTSLFVTLPAAAFRGGGRPIVLRVSDGARWSRRFDAQLVGPEPGAAGSPDPAPAGGAR